jgi:myo-inositol-1(or 4)-monophosphatase
VTQARELLPVAEQAMDIARQMVSEHRPAVVSAKGDRDMVSDIDVSVERAVRGFLKDRTPDIGFMGEEEGDRAGQHELRWVLDPIDGTANFVKGIPLYAISLALVSREQPVLGIVDVPADGSRYTAAAGAGAFHGSTRIHVRPTDKLSEATVTIGDYAVGEDAAAKNRSRLAVTGQLAERTLRVRMLGSAAIDLAWFAHGRTDAAMIFGGKPWDVAAGVILVREAGGLVIDAHGSRYSLDSTSLIATSRVLLDELLGLMGRARTGIADDR